MRIHIKLAEFVVVAVAFSRTTFSQGTQIGPNCDLSPLGAKDATAFRLFDREIHEAVNKLDKGKVALLVNYPLRVNSARAATTSKIQLSFTVCSKTSTLACPGGGIMYGNGTIWVEDNGHGYGISAINNPSKMRRRIHCQNVLRWYAELINVGSLSILGTPENLGTGHGVHPTQSLKGPITK